MKRSIGLALLALAAACAPKNEFKPPPPPEVTVAPPVARDVVEYAEFTGSTTAHRVVEIRARVEGYLKKISYEPGQVVQEGATLFQIDPTEFQANVNSAKADVESAKADLTAAQAAVESKKASLALAETAVMKLEKAYKSRAVSEILVLEVKAQRDVARAELDKANAQVEISRAHIGVFQARLERTELDLSWTTVRAPMAGRVAMWESFEGDLVGANEATLLTRIYNIETVFCYFDVSEFWMLEVRRRLLESQRAGEEPGDLEVEMGLANEAGFPHKGKADYSEPTIDPGTGTLRARATFANTGYLIPSGAFARVRLPINVRKGALMVSERALGKDQSGDFLLLVNSEDVVERHSVELGTREDGLVAVIKGLRAEDRVIVAGLQRARPGAKVNPQPEKKQ